MNLWRMCGSDGLRCGLSLSGVSVLRRSKREACGGAAAGAFGIEERRNGKFGGACLKKHCSPIIPCDFHQSGFSAYAVLPMIHGKRKNNPETCTMPFSLNDHLRAHPWIAVALAVT